MNRIEDAEEFGLAIVGIVDVPALAVRADCSRFADNEDDLVDHMAECRLHKSLAPIAEAFNHLGEDTVEALYEAASRAGSVNGVFLQTQMPIREYRNGDTNSWRSSWGYTRLGWVYGNTFDEAYAAAVEWAAEQVAAMESSPCLT